MNEITLNHKCIEATKLTSLPPLTMHHAIVTLTSKPFGRFIATVAVNHRGVKTESLDICESREGAICSAGFHLLELDEKFDLATGGYGIHLLSLTDIPTMINIFSERACVYVGKTNRSHISEFHKKYAGRTPIWPFDFWNQVQGAVEGQKPFDLSEPTWALLREQGCLMDDVEGDE